MGLLDDLRNQAEGRRKQEEQEAAEQARREAIYREEIQPRMTKAYQYFLELIEHLNYVKPEILVDYPLLKNAQYVSLRQDDYTIVIDSSKALKRIDIIFQCTLDAPVEYEIFGKEVVLNQSDKLDRYRINYTRRDRKDVSLELEGAKFKIEGPLPLRVLIEADVSHSVVRLALRNFTDPGVSRYTVKPGEFNEEFLDRLGKFMLRQTDALFDNFEMPEEALRQLRQRLQEEQALRDQELREAEEALRAEEEAARTGKKTEFIRTSVRKTVDEKKEQLKELFSRLKAQAKLDKPPQK